MKSIAAVILGLSREEIWDVYRELAWSRIEYRRESRLKNGTHYLFPTTMTKPGRPKNIAFGVFVSRLACEYERHTLRKPVCYWDDIRGEYRGDFLKLCELVAGERLPGQSVQLVLRSIRLTKTAKRPGPKAFPPKGTFAAFILEVFRA